jgi:hypothetical protein
MMKLQFGVAFFAANVGFAAVDPLTIESLAAGANFSSETRYQPGDSLASKVKPWALGPVLYVDRSPSAKGLRRRGGAGRMLIAEPRPDVDYKMRVSVPSGEIDQGMLIPVDPDVESETRP